MRRFDRYMADCLYDPDSGFYTARRGRAGRRGGDFLTSPEVGPLFGAVIARQLDRWWEDAGAPATFRVIDVGAGPGTLLRSIEAAEPRCAAALDLVNVDLASGTGPLDGFDVELEGAVVLANELLDNLPFRVVERRADCWWELYESDGEPTFAPVEDEAPPFTTPLAVRAPWLEQAAEWVAGVLEHRPAHLVVFDYGAVSTSELAVRGGWLRTYREHQRGVDPFHEPGEWDITVDVAFDQLPNPDRLASQADRLTAWGIHELVEEGRLHWGRHAAQPDVRAFRMRSRVGEAEALLDPAGLGGFWVAEWLP